MDGVRFGTKSGSVYEFVSLDDGTGLLRAANVRVYGYGQPLVGKAWYRVRPDALPSMGDHFRACAADNTWPCEQRDIITSRIVEMDSVTFDG